MSDKIQGRFAILAASMVCAACSGNSQDADQIRSKDALLTPREATRSLDAFPSVESVSTAPSKEVCQSALQAAEQFEDAFHGAMRISGNGNELSASVEAWAQVPQQYQDNLLAIVALVARCKGKAPRADQMIVVRDQLTGRIIYKGKPQLGLVL